MNTKWGAHAPPRRPSPIDVSVPNTRPSTNQSHDAFHAVLHVDWSSSSIDVGSVTGKKKKKKKNASVAPRSRGDASDPRDGALLPGAPPRFIRPLNPRAGGPVPQHVLRRRGAISLGPSSSSALFRGPSPRQLCKRSRLVCRWASMQRDRRVQEKRHHSLNKGSTRWRMKPDGAREECGQVVSGTEQEALVDPGVIQVVGHRGNQG
ncbi:hypothetical protein CRUP_037473 [Coryphaenoides rupestris]|nr:hypothetical protein CRUP_037473 [Coryphaenoides rupestris]